MFQEPRILLEVSVNRRGKRFEESLSGLKIGCVQHLKVGYDNLLALVARLIESTCQQGGFAHLAGALYQHDTVLARNGGAKLFVHRPYDVVF